MRAHQEAFIVICLYSVKESVNVFSLLGTT